jgi:hypothetical protein
VFNCGSSDGPLLNDFDPISILDPQVHSFRQLRRIEAAEPTFGNEKHLPNHGRRIRDPLEPFGRVRAHSQRRQRGFTMVDVRRCTQCSRGKR